MINIAKRHNLVNEVFGHLTVIAETKNKKGAKAWLVECDCENKTQLIIETERLVSGRKRHCGCRKERKTRDKINLPEEYYIKTKECVQCGKDKKYAEYYFQECFDKDNNITYTFHTICIECSKKNIIKHRKENPKETRIKQAQYVSKIRDYVNQRFQKWLEKHPEREEYMTKYRQDHPDKMQQYGKKRTKKKHIITDEEWIACKEYFKNEDEEWACAYCGKPISKNIKKYRGELKQYDLEKEHVIDDGRNDIKNCIPSCCTCNSKKKLRTLNEFYNLNNPNYIYERYYKIYTWLRYDYKKHIMPKRKHKRQRISDLLKEIENNKNKMQI